jgi:hypothetical protein
MSSLAAELAPGAQAWQLETGVQLDPSLLAPFGIASMLLNCSSSFLASAQQPDSASR